MNQNSPQPQVFTYAHYRTWQDGRFELINGEAQAMSPAPTTAHQRLVLALAAQIDGGLLGQPCEVFVAPFDVRLPEPGEDAETCSNVVQPDISVICSPDKIDEAGCLGAPDWVIEILSPTTAAMDQIRKRHLYERHGVREYWLIHPQDRILTRYRLSPNQTFGAAEISEAAGASTSELFPNLRIDWAKAFARFPAP